MLEEGVGLLGGLGHSCRVIACILFSVSTFSSRSEGQNVLPVKGTGKHEEIIAGQLVHPTMEFAVVDEAAGFADYEEREDDPAFH
jgi:hypothetical protein